MAGIREKKEQYVQGLADVRVLLKSVRVHFEDGEVYDLPLDAWEKGRSQGKYIVTLTRDKDGILGLRPVAAQYVMMFKQIGGRVNDIPSVKTSPAGIAYRKDGRPFPKPAELLFVAEYEIVEGIVSNGIYGGLVVSTMVPYSFARPASGTVVDFADSKYNLERVERFFRNATGKTLVDIDFAYAENPSEQLLIVEKYVLANNRPVMAPTNDKGFVQDKSMSPAPVELMPKKAAKKGKK